MIKSIDLWYKLKRGLVKD